jgi:hypothetical protein
MIAALTRWGRKYFLSERRAAYRNFREAPHARVIIADLMEFTYALEAAPLEGNEFMQGRMAGRRDVFLRIMQHCHLNEKELYNIYTGRPISEGVNDGGRSD